MAKEETPIRLNLEKERPALLPGLRTVEKEKPPELVGFEASEVRVWKAALWCFLTLISILSISVPAIYVAKGLHYLDLSDTALGAYGGVVLGGQGLLALAAKYILAPFLTLSFDKSGRNHSPSQRPGGSKRSAGARRSAKGDTAGGGVDRQKA